jgi:hypothetical protein
MGKLFKTQRYRDLMKLVLVFMIIGAWACKHTILVPVDEKSVSDFHQMNLMSSNELNRDVKLFIDYSTCVAQAVRTSDFFRQIRPRITGLNPILYGIKGDKIDSISGNKDFINQELSQVNEIPYANLEEASQRICSGNCQAILITDGEYWTEGMGERTDLAYLKDPFIMWLSKGHDIYVYIEKYSENYNGHEYLKNRFYFLFTDDKLPGNIYQELNKAFSVSPLTADLKLIRISNTDIGRSGTLSVFPDIESSLVTDHGCTAIEVTSEWKDIDTYVLNAKDSIGNSIEGGKFLLSGLKLASDAMSAYDYPEVGITVYNVTQSYLNNTKTDLSSCEVKDMFLLDEALYRRTGEIGIKISGDYYNSLKEGTENLFRIDIYAKKTLKRINREDLQWTSLSKNEINSSVYESILQTIDNSTIDPAETKNPLYTIYLKTNSIK